MTLIKILDTDSVIDVLFHHSTSFVFFSNHCNYGHGDTWKLKTVYLEALGRKEIKRTVYVVTHFVSCGRVLPERFVWIV